MAAVSKGSGKYFYDNDRIWAESQQTGIAPFFVGNWGGRIAMPSEPTKDFIRDACEGKKYLGRVQANRIPLFDLTYTCSKSASILLFGLTPHAQWKQKSSKLLVDASRPEIEQFVGNQRANQGAQGQRKVKSQGGAIGFVNWESSRKVVHAHVHFGLPNLTATENGKPQSIANANDLFVEQGLTRARFNKRLDDLFQDRGFVTRREGRAVGIAGIPEAMIERLSPSRQAMREAMRRKGFTSPRAQDFYARHARRAAGPRTLGDPREFNKVCWRLAKKYGVTVQSLKRPAGSPAPHRDKYTAASVAHDVAVAARDSLSKKFGSFTKEQFLERAFTLSIGKATTFEAVDTFAGAALENSRLLDIKKQRQVDGTVRYVGPASQQAQQAASQAFKPDTKTAWDDLKRAAKGLGEAALVATAEAGVRVLNRLAETVNPPPRIVTLDALALGPFVDLHRPTPYLLAHAKALFRGMLARGNPHDKAYVAEKAFALLRDHHRVPKNSVIVVERGTLASARELHLLTKIARRDKASVVLADRPRGGGGGGLARSQSGHNQRVGQQREHDLGL